VLRPPFKKKIKIMNYEEYGGAPLMGIDGVVFACHGKYTSRAIRRALISTCNYVEGRVNEHIREELARHAP